LPDAVELLSTDGQGAYLGHVIVLWSWALKQPVKTDPAALESVAVRFQSLDGRDREMEVPHLMFTEPISGLLGAAP
jgi:hypothetical protein